MLDRSLNATEFLESGHGTALEDARDLAEWLGVTAPLTVLILRVELDTESLL
jgi:hypothetical protein